MYWLKAQGKESLDGGGTWLQILPSLLVPDFGGQAHQHMMTLAQLHTDAMKEIVNSNTGGGSRGGMTDKRGIGRPLVFKEDEQRNEEWKANLFAVPRVSSPQAVVWISWAGSQPSTINEEVIYFGNRLYAIPLCTAGDPCNICYSVTDGNDLEAHARGDEEIRATDARDEACLVEGRHQQLAVEASRRA